MSDINFLNNLELNRNKIKNAQLIKAQIENQPNDAAVGGTPVEGQLYFNTTDDVLKVYANGSWVESGGGVESISPGTSTYIGTAITGTSSVPIVTASLSATDGSAVTGTRFLSKDNTWDVPAYTTNTDTGVTSVVDTEGTSSSGTPLIASISGRVLTIDSRKYAGGSNIGYVPQGGSSGNYLRGDGTWVNPNTTYSMDVPSSTTSINLKGTNPSSNDAIALVGSGLLQVTRTNASTLAFATTATNNIGDVISVASGNANTISIGGTTANPTVSAVTAAVTNGGSKLATGDQIYDFVTAQIGNIPSGLSFEGNWNASTDDPALAGTTPNNGVFYIVTTAGSTSLSGITDWKVGDWAVYVSNGAGTDAWQKIDNTSTLSGSGATNQISFWTNASSLAGDTGLTYNSSSNALTAGSFITSSNGNSANWKQAYDNYVASASVSGTTTKTITFTQRDGGTFTTSFTDINTTYTAGTGLTLSGTTFNANVDGTQSVAANSSSTTAGKTYKVQVDSSDNLVVNVPWVNTDAISSVVASTTSSLNGLKATTSNGEVTIGLDIDSLSAISNPASFSSNDLIIPLFNDDGLGNQKIRIAQLMELVSINTFSKSGSIAVGQTTGTVTHAFGIKTIVQTIDSSGNTVFCDISRTSTSVTATISATQSGAITIMVQKIA